MEFTSVYRELLFKGNKPNEYEKFITRPCYSGSK